MVGNPKPVSRTGRAATILADSLGYAGVPEVFDLARLGPPLLDPASSEVRAVSDSVRSVNTLVVASPTYKGSYTGLLKLFLDALPDLDGVTAVALMLGGDRRHSLAPEVFLKPVLVALGASCPTPALFLPESDYANQEVIGSWASRFRPLLPPA